MKKISFAIFSPIQPFKVTRQYTDPIQVVDTFTLFQCRRRPQGLSSIRNSQFSLTNEFSSPFFIDVYFNLHNIASFNVPGTTLITIGRRDE